MTPTPGHVLTRFHVANARAQTSELYGPLYFHLAVMSAPELTSETAQTLLGYPLTDTTFEIVPKVGMYRLVFGGAIFHQEYPTHLDAENAAWWLGLQGATPPDRIRAGYIPFEVSPW